MPEAAVWLASEADVAGFRREARRKLVEGVEPAALSWHVATAAEGELFGSPGDVPPAVADGSMPETSSDPRHPPEDDRSVAAPVKVPPFFVPLCERAGLHAEPGRFGLLYRLLWRLTREPGLRDDPLDADRQQAELMARAVRRDMHKMTAFVRFRPLAGEHVAWFEPEHHIVEATAPFFARRFAQMKWAILTPRTQRAMGR